MKSLIAALFILCALQGRGQDTNTVTVTRNVFQGVDTFVVQYTYRTNVFVEDVPATHPSQHPHFKATITVFQNKLNEKSKVQVGDAFPGVYVDDECLDDNPIKHVEYAQELARQKTGK